MEEESVLSPEKKQMVRVCAVHTPVHYTGDILGIYWGYIVVYWGYTGDILGIYCGILWYTVVYCDILWYAKLSKFPLGLRPHHARVVGPGNPAGDEL